MGMNEVFQEQVDEDPVEVYYAATIYVCMPFFLYLLSI